MSMMYTPRASARRIGALTVTGLVVAAGTILGTGASAQAAVSDTAVTLTSTGQLKGAGTDYSLALPVEGEQVDATFGMRVTTPVPAYVDTLGLNVTWAQTSGAAVTSALDLPVRVNFHFTSPSDATLTSAGITSDADRANALWMTGTLGPQHFDDNLKPLVSTIGQLNDEFAALPSQDATGLRQRLYEGSGVDMTLSFVGVPQNFGGTISYQLYSQASGRPVTDTWTLKVQAPNTPSNRPIITTEPAAVHIIGRQDTDTAIAATVNDPVRSVAPGQLRVRLDGGRAMNLNQARATVGAMKSPGTHTLTYTYTSPHGASAVTTTQRLWVQEPFASPAGDLRIVSYNLFGGNSAGPTDDPAYHKYDLEQQAAFIKSLNADVIGLQEVDDFYHANSDFTDMGHDLASMLGMHWCYAKGQTKDKLDPLMPNTDRSRGVGILSRYPITNCQGYLLTHARADHNNSTVAQADLDVNGQPVRVFDTHLYAGGSSADTFRSQQLADVLAIVAAHADGTPQFITGDFNTDSANPIMQPAFTALSDAWTASGNPADGGKTSNGWDPTNRIDYVFADPSSATPIRAVAAYVPSSDLARRSSDHRPVVADFTLN